MKMFFEGLKFGMILQMAIGPMCLMVFNTSKNMDFLTALFLVIAISLVDAFYITLSCLGVSKLLEKPRYKKISKILGAFVLIFFGLNIMLNVFGVNIVPGLNLKPTAASIFIQGLVLTLSNPLTIIFWTGVLVTKIAKDQIQNKKLVIFSCGLVSATLIFLSFVAILGTICSSFISESISDILNILVGLFLIFFGIKLWLKN